MKVGKCLLTVVFLLGALGRTVLAQQPNDPYDVTIVFTGLMSFDRLADGTYSVMIPKVSRGPLGDDDHTVHRHIPYILADRRYMPESLPNSELNQNLSFEDAAYEGGTYHYLLLDGEGIVIDDANLVPFNNAALSYKTDVPPANVHCPNSADTSKSVYFLPSMKRITGVDPLFRDNAHFDRLPDRKLIAARVMLRYGELIPRVMEPGSIWDFRTPAGSGQQPGVIKHTQAVAQEVHWTFKAKHVPFILNLVGFDGTGRSVAFTPQQKKVVIIIANTMTDETGPLAVGSGPEPRDLHFSVYHQFVAGNGSGRGPIPHRRSAADQTCRAQGYDQYLQCPTLLPSGVQTCKPTVVAVPTPVASVPRAESAHSSHGSISARRPTPGGLNCAPNEWP